MESSPIRRRLAKFSLCLVSVWGVGVVVAGGYIEPKVDEPLFAGEEVALLEVDRTKLSTNLAAFVTNTIKPTGNSRELTNARRLIGLALHLDPRNRAAVVANFQYKRGVAPKEVKSDYSPGTLAEILRSRAASLLLQKGDLNHLLAGFMLAAAVEIDPKNEVAVYELEMYRKDVAEVDWTPVTGR